MTIQALTLGYSVDAGSPIRGVVHSVFPHAVNCVVDEGFWTLLAASKSDLPFGVRVHRDDLTGLGLAVGDAVAVRAGYIAVGGSVVDCRAARRWTPAPWPALQRGLADRLQRLAPIAGPRCWPTARIMAHQVVAAMLQPQRLDDAVSRVIGRGPGLTPSGDDVLVGVLAVLTSPWAGDSGAEAARSLTAAIERHAATTTDVSRHLLRQAGSGRFSRPLEELMAALAADALPVELITAARAVVDIGATSGADTCMGLLETASRVLLSDEKAAA